MRVTLTSFIGLTVLREASAILSGSANYEGESRFGQWAIGEAMGVLRRMCEAAGITPRT
ncbi:MAG TPA: hypothetical protein VK436_12435 [Methanocella sp.]|nr:hypothetical protein [Methanocella sp.]